MVPVDGGKGSPVVTEEQRDVVREICRLHTRSRLCQLFLAHRDPSVPVSKAEDSTPPLQADFSLARRW
jgi:hypothetical protein